MKPNARLVESVKDVSVVRTNGDLRNICSQLLLSLVRGEVSDETASAAAKLLTAISQNLDSEVKLSVAAAGLRERGAHITKQVFQIGSTPVDSSGCVALGDTRPTGGNAA